MLSADTLRRQFARVVAPLEIDVEPTSGSGRRSAGRSDDFALDVTREHGQEEFVLRLDREAAERWEFSVPNADPARRHLLLVARLPSDAREAPRHFLCGHDERHLFVAGVASRVTTVAAAMDALKPPAVLASEAEHHVRTKARNRRHNPGFVRQGEWFFLPRPDFAPKVPQLVLRDEPLRRGGGKAHVVEQLYRAPGERVWVCDRYPQGVTDSRYQALLKSRPGATRWAWRLMTRTSFVYAMGRVRHPDHATISLPGWHLVVASREAGASVAFLD